MFTSFGPSLLLHIQVLCKPDATLLALTTAALSPKAPQAAGPERTRYLAAIPKVLAHMLPCVVHSYIKEFIGDRQEADAAKKGRAKARATCHRDIMDFVQFLKKVPPSTQVD